MKIRETVYEQIENHAAIRHIVESQRARNARVFGSVLTGQIQRTVT